MKILFLSRWFPYPTTNGSKLRIYNLLRGLSSIHDVTLISFADESGIDLNSPAIRSMCEEVVLVPIRQYHPDGLKSMLGFFSPVPRYYREMYSIDMARSIEDAFRSHSIDLVIASQIDTAAYLKHFHGCQAIFDEVEIAILYERYSNSSRLAERARSLMTWQKHRRYLGKLLTGFEACTVVSLEEKRLLAETIPNIPRVHVIPNCIVYQEYQQVKVQPEPNTLIFTGSFRYPPNYEAMLWFTQAVMPLIRDKITDVRLVITGDTAGKDLSHLAGVQQTGVVDDIRSLIASAWISLAPLLRGGGTRLKILEAMALGTPVVSSPKGVQGIDASPGENILVADQPEEFAEAVYKILIDKELRSMLAINGQRLVREKYDWDAVLPEFLSMIEETAVL